MSINRERNYWLKAKTPGKPKKIASPDNLWHLACLYFHEVDGTHWITDDYRGGKVEHTPITKQRPYSWSGFHVFLYVSGVVSNIHAYKANVDGSYDEYADVISVIDDVIRTQKFEGAVLRDFDRQVIMKDLGMEGKEDRDVPIFNINVNKDGSISTE